MIRSRRTISVLTSDSLLYRLSVALRYTCGIKEKCKHRFLADAVGDEEIDMGVVVACVCQFLLRHKGGVLDNLSERYVAKHFQAGETVVSGEYVVDEMIGHVL